MQLDTPTPATTDTLRHALRVPSLVLGKWVYLRIWSTYPQKNGPPFGERTYSCRLGVVTAFGDGTDSRIRVNGLEPVRIPSQGSFEDNQRAVDAYLLSLGAEIVPTSEWPTSGEGVGLREVDRTPFRMSDWDSFETRMLELGYDNRDPWTATPKVWTPPSGGPP